MTELKQIRVPLRGWETERDRIVVWIRPVSIGHDEWDVFADAGGKEHLGTVGKYLGTLDRPISRGSRIVHRGKRRTLWHYRTPKTKRDPYPRSMWEQLSRADCIRRLVRLAEHERSRQTSR